jgi:hypothetical protein
MNLPQQTITGLLDGNITRVFEVMEPQPDEVIKGRVYHQCYQEMKEGDSSPFGPPGTIHTIGGQQFEVVESGEFQMNNSFKYAANPSNAEALLAALPNDTPNDAWLWTAELRRKEEDE